MMGIGKRWGQEAHEHHTERRNPPLHDETGSGLQPPMSKHLVPTSAALPVRVQFEGSLASGEGRRFGIRYTVGQRVAAGLRRLRARCGTRPSSYQVESWAAPRDTGNAQRRPNDVHHSGDRCSTRGVLYVFGNASLPNQSRSARSSHNDLIKESIAARTSQSTAWAGATAVLLGVLLTLWIAKGDDLHLLVSGSLWQELVQWIAAVLLLGLGLYCHTAYLDSLADAFATGGTTHESKDSKDPLIIPDLFDPSVEKLRDAQFWLLIAGGVCSALALLAFDTSLEDLMRPFPLSALTLFMAAASTVNAQEPTRLQKQLAKTEAAILAERPSLKETVAADRQVVWGVLKSSLPGGKKANSAPWAALRALSPEDQAIAVGSIWFEIRLNPDSREEFETALFRALGTERGQATSRVSARRGEDLR